MATSKTYYLPEELAMKVLLCLPVKDLIPCKLVCKQWLSITLDPDFIQTHLTNSHKRPSVLTSATVYDMKGGSHHTVSIISNSFEDSVNIPVPPSCSAPDHSSTSCNGLMCLSDDRGIDIYLWNPSTRQGKKIPSLEIKECVVLLVCIAFYFDSISNDYKILRLVFCYHNHDPTRTQLKLRVELYSTKSDSWTEIQVDDADARTEMYHRYNGITSGPVIKRVLYLNGCGGLISFQLNKKMLKPVPLPSNCSIDYEQLTKRWEPKVFEFEGCVALILRHDNDESLSLWTLDDDDDDGRDKVSWTKKLNLESDIMKNWTSISLDVGQLVASEDFKRIILYDYKKKETKTHRLQLPSSWYIDSFFRYTESLVSVNGFSRL